MKSFVAWHMVLGAIETADSVAFLCKHQRLRDALILSRTVYEYVVNALFVSVSDPKIAHRALFHSAQSGFRSADRKHLALSAIPASGVRRVQVPRRDPRLEKMIALYTRPKGSAIKEWAAESLDQKLALIRKQHPGACSRLLTLVKEDIYDDASQAAHGSLAGFLLRESRLDYFGSGAPRIYQNPQDVAGVLCMHATALLFLTFHSIPARENIRSEAEQLRLLVEEAYGRTL